MKDKMEVEEIMIVKWSDNKLGTESENFELVLKKTDTHTDR